MIKIILIVAVIIVAVVLLVTLKTTSKAYQYKHTIDPIEDNPHLSNENEEKKHHTHD